MLLEFKVANFKSIKDVQVFSMIRGSKEKALESNFATITLDKIGDSSKEIDVLKTSAIYGANASGKSNLIEAIFTIRNIIINSHQNQQGDLLPIEPFKLDETYRSLPSYFEFIFIEEAIKYSYFVKLNKNIVEEENLYFYPRGRKQRVFLRKGNKIEINFGSTKLDEMDKVRQQIYAEDIADNILFLSLANRIKLDAVKNAFKWFLQKLVVIPPNQRLLSTTTPMLNDHIIDENMVLKYLQVADPLISKISIELEEKLDNNPLMAQMRQHMLSHLSDRMSPNAIQEMIKQNKFSVLKEKFMRYGKNKAGELIPVEFTIEEESVGTQKYYSLIGPLVSALRNGNVLICDELDTSMHPLLMQSILELFTSEQNKSNAQLIISTHNVYFLDKHNLFRKDQIWLTEKSISGETNLYSINDFNNTRREDLSSKTYLKGKFGAIPSVNMWEIFDV